MDPEQSVEVAEPRQSGIWRTGWDLNPRQPCGCTAFPVLRLRPDSATCPCLKVYPGPPDRPITRCPSPPATMHVWVMPTNRPCSTTPVVTLIADDMVAGS